MKVVCIDGREYEVDVDFLSGLYEGTSPNKRSQHVQGVKALKVAGGNFAFEFPRQIIKLERKRPDGAMDIANLRVVAVVPYFVMKTNALGRGKAKDAYDLYFIIKHYSGGVVSSAEDFINCADLNIIQEMKVKLSEKFASTEHTGPVDVAAFMDLAQEEEIEMIKRDAYEQVKMLLDLI